MEALARVGYITRGFVYALIGILTLCAAFGIGGKITGTNGALHIIARQPFGRILLALVAIGLLGYVLWRFVQAIKDPGNKGNDCKGLILRLGYGASGLFYLGIAFNAALLVLGDGSSSDTKTKQDWTAMLMQQPFGRWLVGLVGAVVIGVGFYKIYFACKVKFRKKHSVKKLGAIQEKTLVYISRFGIASRGVVFVMTGFFVLEAAKNYNPQKVKGLDEALLTLALQPYGKVLLTIAALGLIAFAVCSLLKVRYRQIEIN